MSHLEDPSFLEDMHAAAKRYVRMLEGCIQRTKELDDQEEAASVTEQVFSTPMCKPTKSTSSHTSLLRPDRPSKPASAGGTATGLGAFPQDGHGKVCFARDSNFAYNVQLGTSDM